MQASGTKQASSTEQATSTKQTTSIQKFKSTYKLVLLRKYSTNETTKIHNLMCLVVKMCITGLCLATSDLPLVPPGVPTNLVTSQVSERMHENQRNFKLVPSRPSTKQTYENTIFWTPVKNCPFLSHPFVSIWPLHCSQWEANGSVFHLAGGSNPPRSKYLFAEPELFQWGQTQALSTRLEFSVVPVFLELSAKADLGNAIAQACKRGFPQCIIRRRDICQASCRLLLPFQILPGVYTTPSMVCTNLRRLDIPISEKS